MTKAELIDEVYQAMGRSGTLLTKHQIEDVIQLTFTHIGQAVRREHRFSMPKFGVFTQRYRKARTGVNPQTGAPIKIPASKTVGFKPAPAFKKLIGEPRS